MKVSIESQLVAVLLLYSAHAALAQGQVQTYGIPNVTTQTTQSGSVMIVATPFDWLEHAKALERQEDWPGLLDWGQRWTRDEPGNALAWYVLGRANSELQRYPEAIAAYQENLRLDATDVYAHTNLGNAYRNSRRYLEAMQAYRDAVRLKSDCVRSWHNLGLTFYTLKGVPGVNQALQRLRETDPQLADAWQKLAIEYSISKDERVARQAIRVLSGLEPARRERMFEILFTSL